jgi:hypothetical protein
MDAPENTLEQRAKNLLDIHNGVCSVREDSPLGEEYKKMEQRGEVEITPMPSMPGVVGFIRVERKAFPL